MKSYLSYTNEIEGFKAVEETVRVVEKSSASHIHFLRKKVLVLTVYKEQIQTTLNRLSRFYRNANHPLLKEESSGEKALLVITGTKGIVGGLYHELVNEAVAQQSGYRHIWVIGKKGIEYLAEENIRAEELFPAGAQAEEFQMQEINKMSSELFNRFQAMGLKKIDVLYSQFLSLAQQKPAIVEFLPFNFVSADASLAHKTLKGYREAFGGESQDKSADGFPIFEPSKKFIFDILIKKYIDVSFAELILKSKLSEFAARTVTAENAIKETEELIGSLRRDFLKDKHRAITQQQLESFSARQTI